MINILWLRSTVWSQLVTYLLLNVAFIYVLPFGELQASPRVAADAMARAVGPRAADATALVVLLSA